jgi:DNA-binding SARP family transcriptional activator
MLLLRTFGGLSLSRGEENLTGAVTQRRRLAILALLAVAHDGGMSRDKLQAFLWPEADAGRARHVLNQLLYAQRRQAGTADLFLGQKTLRLNPAVIVSDIPPFEAALAKGDLEDAVVRYAGPFLDGFYLRDAAEFERWVEDQRARFRRGYQESLAALGQRAAARGQHAAAAGWWRRALEDDPYNALAALALVEALAAAGDRTGAIREGQRHDQRIRAELGVGSDPRLAALLTRLSS